MLLLESVVDSVGGEEEQREYDDGNEEDDHEGNDTAKGGHCSHTRTHAHAHTKGSMTSCVIQSTNKVG